MSAAGWRAVLAASALTVVAVVALDAPPTIRAPLVLWFVLVCPGMAIARLLHFDDIFATWSIAVVVSVALAAVTSGTMVLLEAWAPVLGLAVLVFVCLAAVLADGLVARRTT